MEIRFLVWDARNIAKLAAHDITLEEVEAVLDRDEWVPATHEEYPDQVRMIGPTSGGRMLTVALAPASDAGTWRPVTGWDTSDDEIAYYQEEIGQWAARPHA